MPEILKTQAGSLKWNVSDFLNDEGDSRKRNVASPISDKEVSDVHPSHLYTFYHHQLFTDWLLLPMYIYKHSILGIIGISQQKENITAKNEISGNIYMYICPFAYIHFIMDNMQAMRGVAVNTLLNEKARRVEIAKKEKTSSESNISTPW